jgi:coproporphyrinogen III oxidase
MGNYQSHAKMFGVGEADFFACKVWYYTLRIMVPTVHANWRFLKCTMIAEKMQWFGGGQDLTYCLKKMQDIFIKQTACDKS